MKLIAADMKPLDELAMNMYQKEFGGGESGIVVFPEHSLDSQPTDLLKIISQVYSATLIGTKEQSGFEQAMIIRGNHVQDAQIAYPDIVLPGPLSGIIRTDTAKEILFFENDQLYDVYEQKKAIIRICTDMNISFSKDGKADLLIIPSEIQHPQKHWLEEAICNIGQSLKEDAKIIYAPAKTGNNLQEMGVYNLKLENLAEKKEGYCVLEI